MKAVQGTSRSYYEVFMPKSMVGKKITVKVVGYIQKYNQSWKNPMNQILYDVWLKIFVRSYKKIWFSL